MVNFLRRANKKYVWLKIDERAKSGAQKLCRVPKFVRMNVVHSANENANWIIDANKLNRRAGDSFLIIGRTNNCSASFVRSICSKWSVFLSHSSGQFIGEIQHSWILWTGFFLLRRSKRGETTARLEWPMLNSNTMLLICNVSFGTQQWVHLREAEKKRIVQQRQPNIVCTTPAHWLRFAAEK